MRKKVLASIALVLLVAASWALMRRTKPVATGENAEFTVIGTMQSRDKIVTVKTGAEGIVYTIATKSGETLYEDISAEELKAQAPALHDFIESGTAGHAGMMDVKRFDAGYR